MYCVMWEQTFPDNSRTIPHAMQVRTLIEARKAADKLRMEATFTRVGIWKSGMIRVSEGNYPRRRSRVVGGPRASLAGRLGEIA